MEAANSEVTAERRILMPRHDISNCVGGRGGQRKSQLRLVGFRFARKRESQITWQVKEGFVVRRRTK
jgi:hypothetical protein